MLEYAMYIYNLIERIQRISSKEDNVILEAIKKLEIYPENINVEIRIDCDTVISQEKLNKHPELKWLDESLVQILNKEGINSLLILKDL